jgi:hypothetical protein
MRYWSEYYLVIFSTFFLSLIFLVLSLISISIFSLKSLFKSELGFCLIWFLITLVPVVILPLHKSTYYLYPVLPAIWMGLIYILTLGFKLSYQRFGQLSPLILGLVLGALILLSYISVQLGDQTYWAASRGRLAQKIVLQAKASYPELPKGSIIYIKDDPTHPYVSEDWGGSSKQIAFALNNSDGLRLLYNDPTLEVVYDYQVGPNATFCSTQVYPLTPKIY